MCRWNRFRDTWHALMEQLKELVVSHRLLHDEASAKSKRALGAPASRSAAPRRASASMQPLWAAPSALFWPSKGFVWLCRSASHGSTPEPLASNHSGVYLYIGFISAAPTACPLRMGVPVLKMTASESTGTPLPAQRTWRW